jgi:hypothetical protein
MAFLACGRAVSTPTYTMSYSPQVISAVKKAPKTLGNQLGRWAIHLDFPVIEIAKYTGATRQTVYNWFIGRSIPMKSTEQKINRFILALSR